MTERRVFYSLIIYLEWPCFTVEHIFWSLTEDFDKISNPISGLNYTPDVMEFIFLCTLDFLYEGDEGDESKYSYYDEEDEDKDEKVDENNKENEDKDEEK